MEDEARRAKVTALLIESMDLYAAVVAVCRVIPEDRAFTVGVLKLDIPSFEAIESRWQQKLERDPALRMTFQTLTQEYEWSFRQLKAGAAPVVEP